MQKFKVSLEGFTFLKHVGPDGRAYLAPVHREGYDTKPENATEWVVEASDGVHAEAVFKRTMGIRKTDRDFKVTLVADAPRPRPELDAPAPAAAPSQSSAAAVVEDEDLEEDEEDPAELVDLGDEPLLGRGHPIDAVSNELLANAKPRGKR